MKMTFPGAAWLRYALAVCLVFAAILVKLSLDVYVIAETPFFLVRAAVLLIAYFFGLGPALLALLLASLAVEYLFLPPVRSFALESSSVVRLISFFGETLLIIWIITVLKASRKEAHQTAGELEQSQALFREFMQNNPAVAFMKDDHGRHVYVNRTGEEVFGWPEGSWKGKTTHELWPFATAENNEAHDKAVLQTGELTKFLEYADVPGRGRLYFDTYKFPVVSPAGERFIAAVAIEITERIKADRALREQQAHFRQLADSMPQIVWTLSADGRTEYFNKRWYEFSGFIREPEEGDQASWMAVLHPDDFNSVGQSFAESLRTGEPFTCECRFRDLASGDYRWFLVRANPGRDEDGEIVKWYGTATDIHEQRKAVEAALYSEMRLRSLASASSQVIWTAGVTGAFLEPQSSWSAYTGQTWEEHQGFGWLDAIHPDDRDKVRVIFERSLEQQSSFETSGRIWYAPTQQYRYFRMNAVPITDEATELREWIGTIADVDEQHRAEEALQESVQRVQAIFDRMTDAFYAVDENWNFTYLNRQAEVLLHRKSESLLGKNLWAEFPAGIGTRFQHEYELAMQTRLPRQFEEYYPPPLDAWFEVHAYPGADGLSVYFRNVNERRRAELALREREAQFRATYEQAAVGIAQIGTDGRYIRVNAKFSEICGYPPDQLSEFTYHDISLEEDAVAEAAQVARLFAGEIPSYTFEKRYRRPAGDLRWVRITSSLAGEPNTPGAYRIAIVEDIHDAKRAEVELARSEQRYRSLVTAIAHIVWRTDVNGMVEDMPGWRELTGQTVEEVSGLGWLDALHPEDREHVSRLWQNAFETQNLYEAEYRIRLKNGSYRWLSVRGAPVQEPDGTVREWVGICVDINDQKRAEEQMQQAAEAMGVARDAAVQASRSKSAFLANMSHELRTPLNAILGYAELLQEDLAPIATSQMMDDLRRITSAGNTLLALVNDVLDLSKIEAGRMTLQLTTFSVTDLVSEVVATVHPLCERNSNRLLAEPSPEWGTIHADQVKVRQTLVNLLSNACKFTENGEIRLQFEREEGHEGAGFVLFKVSDTGIGIATEDQKRLFQEFTQLDPSFTRKYSGTGLGLAISRRFTEMMGGRISVSSSPGEGSTFTVRLPAHVTAPPLASVPY